MDRKAKTIFKLIYGAATLLVCLMQGRECRGQVLGSPLPQVSAHKTEPSLYAAQPVMFDNPNPRAPLVAIMEFQTTEDCKGELEISDGVRQWKQEFSGNTRQHRLAVTGLVPARTHEIVVVVESADGRRIESSRPLQYAAPDLPNDFPPIRILSANSQQMEPGITMFAVSNWKRGVSMMDYGFLIALDGAGQVVWYCRTGDRTSDFRTLRNGHLLYQHGSYRYLYEIDLLGNDVRCWYASRSTAAPNDQAIAVDVDTLHHELLELPNGHFMSLATELRYFEKYPTSESDPNAPWAPAWVVCDEVVEFDPLTGSVVQRLPLTGLLDIGRFGYLALGDFWLDKYDEFLESPARDWSHANSLQYLPEDDSIIVSLRHLDCVIKIDWKKKELRWILGDPKNWAQQFQPFLLRPKGNLEWFYHQHAAHVASDGNLMMFDNGNYRTVPYDAKVLAPDNFSRVVSFQIDAESMTVEQIFSYGEEQSKFYSPFFGDVDRLSVSGNLLVTDGGRIEDAQGMPWDEVPGARQWARIFEITADRPPKKVFELICDSPIGSIWGWSIYRSQRYSELSDCFHATLPPGSINVNVLKRNAVVKKNPLHSYKPKVVSQDFGNPP